MSQNQEIIESKLCAYIDGELDPEGRAEIEKHLEANPQHRRLLESLRATRDLLRWLPREPAPAEIAETLNGQLERSVLLNYEGEHLGPSIWPKVFAAAAIVALTTGLGVAVYYALPRSQSPAQLALHAPAEPASGNADVVPAPLATTDESARADSALRERGGVERDREAYASKAGPSDMAAARDKDQLAAATPSPTASTLAEADNRPRTLMAEKKSAELDQLAQQVAQNPGAFVAFAGNASNSLGLNANPTQNGNSVSANALVLLVKSDAPEQTEKQLTAYFNEQQIQWRQAPLTFQSEASLQQSTLGGAAQNRAINPNVNAKVMRREAGAEYRAVAEPAKRGEEPAPAAPAEGASPSIVAGIPTTQPAPAGAIAGRAESQNEGVAQQQQRVSQIQQDATQAAMANTIRSDGIYVCQMSRQQAAQLSNTINTATNPAAQVQDLSNQTNNNSAPQFQYGASPSGGGGAGLAGGPATERLSDNRQRSMKAAGGLESEQAPKQAAADAKDVQAAGAARSAPVLSKPAAPEPAATQPAAADAAVAQAAPPATQPAQVPSGPTTAPADEPVNVVIMVQSNPAVSNAAAPAPAAPAAPPAVEVQPQQQQPTPPASTSQNQQQAK